MLTLVTKCTIIPVAVLVELLISIYTVKKYYDTKQRYVGCRFSSAKHYLLLSSHILALWNFLTTVQLFTMIAVPLGVLLPVHPQVTIDCATSTSWFHTHCCLCAVSVSKTKKEKFPEQCKVLWKYVCDTSIAQ